MNKQLAAALALGAVLGAGGKAVVDSALAPAEAGPATHFTHAVDLRRDYATGVDGGLRFVVYATEQRPDGGSKDVGQAVRCAPSAATLAGARSVMNDLAKECDWP